MCGWSMKQWFWLVALWLCSGVALAQVAIPATASAGESVPPGAESLLYRAVQASPLKSVYAQNHYQPLWTPAKLQQAQQLVQRAAEDGLESAHYPLPETLSDTLAGDAGAAELEASRHFYRFVADLTTGRVNPAKAGAEIDYRAHAARLPQRFYQLLSGDDLEAGLESLRPQAFGYPALKRLLNSELASEAERAQALPPLERSLRPAMHWEGVPQLALLLVAQGDLPSVQARVYLGETLYGGELVQAVRRFQRRHALTDDGIVGAQTYAQLQRRQPALLTAAAKATIRVNLERLRWLDPSLAAERYLWVNLPAFELQVYDRNSHFGAPLFDMAVVIGQVGRNSTPMKAKPLASVVFSPYWNIPTSIARAEYWPKQHANPDFLASKNMEVTANGGLRQRPGPGNALGQVKFMLPNDDAIYLHDTPSKQLFNRPRRDFSHGCVRVAKPELLAQFIMRDAMSDAQIRSAMQAGRERHVPVRDKPPVVLMYATATVDGNGALQLYPDLYGRDAELARLLSNP